MKNGIETTGMEASESERSRCGRVELSLSHHILSTKRLKELLIGTQIYAILISTRPLSQMSVSSRFPCGIMTARVAKRHIANERLKLRKRQTLQQFEQICEKSYRE